MDSDRKRLSDLIASVADGGPIDWEALLNETTADEELHGLLRDLQTVAGVAQVHRSHVEQDDDPTDVVPVPAPGAAGAWGNFLFVQKIGEGQFGEVYHARDTLLDHAVALKLLKPDLVDPSRILHEARTLAKVRHTNVVQVYGADLRQGRIGFWMELIQGQTLAQIVEREGVRSASEAAAIGQHLCRALATVHASGIVHRDVKAQNVMRETGTGRLVLMDFGAGERLDDARGRATLTGTPLYLAPELLTRGAATFQSDIYALGVLLFYLVTRRYPIEATTFDELLEAHDSGRRHHLSDLRPDLPDVFVRVVDRMLAPDRATRYPTAGAVRAALETVVAPDTRDGRQSYTDRRSFAERVGIWGATAAVVLAFVTLLGLASTATFNLTFGRSGDFAGESPFQWFGWGLAALVSPLVRIGLAVAGVMVLVAIARIAGRIVTPLGAAASRARRAGQKLARERGLNDVTVQLQILTGIGVLGFAFIAWVFWDAFTAFAVYINDAPQRQLAALQPANEARYDAYGRALELLLFLYGCGLYVVYRNAKRSSARTRTAVAIAAIAVPVLALLLIRALPYRIVYQNRFPRVDLGDERCYEIGERRGELLLHCPDVRPPRNRVVTDSDPQLNRRGVVESVFTPGTRAGAPVSVGFEERGTTP